MSVLVVANSGVAGFAVGTTASHYLSAVALLSTGKQTLSHSLASHGSHVSWRRLPCTLNSMQVPGSSSSLPRLPSQALFNLITFCMRQQKRLSSRSPAYLQRTSVPGPIDADLFRDGKPPQVISFIANAHPHKRLGQPEEVASAVAFLASPEASWVNGQSIRVNGVSTIHDDCVIQHF